MPKNQVASVSDKCVGFGSVPQISRLGGCSASFRDNNGNLQSGIKFVLGNIQEGRGHLYDKALQEITVTFFHL